LRLVHCRELAIHILTALLILRCLIGLGEGAMSLPDRPFVVRAHIDFKERDSEILNVQK
jgi:hypothetical protein